jgi:hypothetical protein
MWQRIKEQLFLLAKYTKVKKEEKGNFLLNQLEIE